MNAKAPRPPSEDAKEEKEWVFLLLLGVSALPPLASWRSSPHLPYANAFFTALFVFSKPVVATSSGSCWYSVLLNNSSESMPV